jgi:hypothetical protein
MARLPSRGQRPISRGGGGGEMGRRGSVLDQSIFLGLSVRLLAEATDFHG